MFERYTERARRVIFSARYEASNLGASSIETEHLLLGLLREDRELAAKFLPSVEATESIRKLIETRKPVGDRVSTSVDMPLSEECKRALAFAAEEGERLGHEYIGSAHLFLGLLGEKNCFAAELLAQFGLKCDPVRLQITSWNRAETPPRNRAETPVAPQRPSGCINSGTGPALARAIPSPE